ncbi:MAG: DNA polymerase IV [Patescibacteria group bacterium]
MKAIVHFDGDSFFASVEQMLNHTLRGKPVVTGGERGAATSISYEAKRLGIRRSMTLKEIRRICPDVHVVNSDYTAYSIYAKRMYAIVRRYTPLVEEYSIDECFADITGLDAHYALSYEAIAEMIKDQLQAELGVTFGVGLASNKVLAKVASKYRKPNGFTHISEDNRVSILKETEIGDIWGIGRATNRYMQAMGLQTAYDFVSKDESWFQGKRLSKPHKELWLELQGVFVKTLSVNEEESIASLIVSRTFAPPSKERAFILSQLSKNIEMVCAKARRHKVLAREITFYLKTQEFTYKSVECALSLPTANPIVILQKVLERFDEAYKKGIEYRATGISLRRLVPEDRQTHDLFGEVAASHDTKKLLGAVDAMNKRYGKQTVFLGSSLSALTKPELVRKNITARTHFALGGEQRKKTIDIPFLGIAR